MVLRDRELIAQAVSNNAAWCDAVCSARGAPGEFLDSIWINRHQTPASYPNAITLVDGEEATLQFAEARELVEMRVSGEWAVKDSFATLDLRPSGFRRLSEAQWISRAASEPRPHDASQLRWAKVLEPSELACWETSWRGRSVDGSAHARVFSPVLLKNENIAFVAGHRGRTIVAGAIANCTGSVVGVSNIFLPEDEMGHVRAGCLASVLAAFPGLPAVGYERGVELTAMRALGFQALAPLTVWLKNHQLV